MQKLGILAAIVLLSAALVGPIGLSFAETTGSNSTTTNSTTTTVTAVPSTSKSTPPTKPLSEEEMIKMRIANELARIAQLHDKKITKLKEQALVKKGKLDDLVAARMKLLEEKRAKAESKSLVKPSNMTSGEDNKMEKKKSMYEDRINKKVQKIEDREADAKKKFEEKMASAHAKFDKKVQMISKKAAQMTEDKSNADSSSKVSDSQGTGTTSAGNSTKNP